MSEANIPVLSLAALYEPGGREKLARAFGAALEEIGFVTIVDHGVPADQVERLYRMAKQFFAAPLEHKTECMLAARTKPYGYLPMGIESVAATLAGEEEPDLCEALVFRRPELDGIGPGAPRNLWPSSMPELKPVVQDYFAALAGLARNLYRLANTALDLPEGYLDPYFENPSFTLRMVNYPEQAVAPKPGQLRYGAHHDYGGLTILHQDNAPGGLQVFDRSGTWRDVPHQPGAFVINVGDLLSRWTNDRWRSTLHRVVNPPRNAGGSTQRLSIVFFTGPARESMISALPSCVSAVHPAKYPPINAGEHGQAKIAASHDLKKAKAG